VNGFSLAHALPVSVFDLRTVTGNLWLRPSRGTERFVGPDGEPASPEVGELILADDAEAVLARHWHGSAALDSMPGSDTTDALVQIDALGVDAEDLGEAFRRLAEAFWGADVELRLLDRSQPQARWT
jgi:DNA/RNA-binding domain of Phe-tRNA-synthetase-like protein